MGFPLIYWKHFVAGRLRSACGLPTSYLACLVGHLRLLLPANLALETDIMASLCRHAMRGQSAMAVVRPGVANKKYGVKTGSTQRVRFVPGATAAVPRRGLHSSSPLRQAATPSQAGSVEAGSAGGESGWTGGDGGDGHTGARTLGIAVFSTMASERKSLSRER